MVNDKIANDIAGLQASRLNNVIDPNPQYTDTTFSKEVTELFDPSCLAYLDSEGRLCVDSVTVSSEIIFNYPFSELMEKGVEEIRIQFSVEGEGSPVFAGFGLGSSTVKDFKSYEIVVNDTVDVDETISTLSFSKEDVAYYMKTGLFRLYLVFLQGNSVCNVKLSNVIVTFTYTNNIINEVKVIENRLEALGITGKDIDVDIVTSWEPTPSDTKVPSEKLTKNTLDTKVDKVTGKGLSANDFTNSYKDTIDGLSTVATTGDYDDLTDKPTIPSKISDLTNDSDFIEKSSTNGLVKNDGTIDTTSYSTFDGDYNNLSNKPTIPSASSTTPSADTSSGSYGSGTSYARSNHTHPKSSLYAEATHSHTKSQITDFPTIPIKTSDLTNDGDGTNAFLTQHQSLVDYVQKSSISGLLKNDGSVDTTQYLSSLPSHNHDDRYYTESEVDTALNGKQSTLISGTNIKTINNQSLLGQGNISIQGGGSDVADLIDVIYPVGCIYMSVNDVNPATLFGGTWEQIQDKFLLASGSTYSNGATGGSATVTLTENEMPSHTHTQQSHSHTNADGNFVTSTQSGANNTRVTYSANGNRMVDGFNTTSGIFHHRPATSGTTAINNATGGGQAHNNMPPYLTVNVWKRTA